MGDSTEDVLAAIVATDDPRSQRAARAADLIRSSTAARWVGIYTVAGGRISNEAWSGPAPPAHPAFSAQEGLTSHAVRVAAVAVSNDVASDARYLTNQDDSGSELIVPIVVGGAVVGTLDVESDAVAAFDGARISEYERLAVVLAPLWQR